MFRFSYFFFLNLCLDAMNLSTNAKNRKCFQGFYRATDGFSVFRVTRLLSRVMYTGQQVSVGNRKIKCVSGIRRFDII